MGPARNGFLRILIGWMLQVLWLGINKALLVFDLLGLVMVLVPGVADILPFEQRVTRLAGIALVTVNLFAATFHVYWNCVRSDPKLGFAPGVSVDDVQCDVRCRGSLFCFSKHETAINESPVLCFDMKVHLSNTGPQRSVWFRLASADPVFGLEPPDARKVGIRVTNIPPKNVQSSPIENPMHMPGDYSAWYRLNLELPAHTKLVEEHRGAWGKFREADVRLAVEPTGSKPLHVNVPCSLDSLHTSAENDASTAMQHAANTGTSATGVIATLKRYWGVQ